MTDRPDLHLPLTLDTWPGEDSKPTLKRELEALDKADLPLQQGLTQGSHVGPSPFSVMILGVHDSHDGIQANAGIFYTGIIAGCNCADDPSPIDELTEYCEITILIDKISGQARIALSSPDS